MKLGQYLKRGREPTSGVGPVSCGSFLVGRTCVSALVDGTGLCLSEGQCSGGWNWTLSLCLAVCVWVSMGLIWLWTVLLLMVRVLFLFCKCFGMKCPGLEVLGLWVGLGLSVDMEAFWRAPVD